VAGRQRHAVDIAGIPRRNDVAPGVRVVFQAVHELADLVDQASVRGFPAPPLLAVDRAEIAIFVGPFVPDANTVGFQVGNIGVALQEPEQLVHDGFEMELLGRRHREALGEVEAHLVAEDGARAGAGAVGLVVPVVEHVAHEIEVLLHGSEMPKRIRCRILHAANLRGVPRSECAQENAPGAGGCAGRQL
jgi:hypothetical protein